LTRRANHRHMFKIARIKPAPETGRGLFDSGTFWIGRRPHVMTPHPPYSLAWASQASCRPSSH